MDLMLGLGQKFENVSVWLSIDQTIAEQIRAEYRDGATNRTLREKYKLAKATVSYIVNGKTWR